MLLAVSMASSLVRSIAISVHGIKRLCAQPDFAVEPEIAMSSSSCHSVTDCIVRMISARVSRGIETQCAIASGIVFSLVAGQANANTLLGMHCMPFASMYSAQRRALFHVAANKLAVNTMSCSELPSLDALLVYSSAA